MRHVNSTCIDAEEYQPKRKESVLHYVGDEEWAYKYFQVQQREYKAFLQVERAGGSIGRFINKQIKKHRYKKIPLWHWLGE